MPEPVLVRYDQLASMGITLSRDTVRRLARKNLFPMPRRLGRHHIVFVASEIEAWIAELPVAGPRPRSSKQRLGGRDGRV